MKPHKNWIAKAASDLKTAKKLISGPDPICDTAIYHAQQCGEKALKAFLIFRNHLAEKLRTHDMELLVEICSEYDSSFTALLENAIILNPYSTAFRYPDIILEPEPDDVHEAIAKAEKILQFINGKLD
jgi:HEPN domain-containing protein